MEHKLVWEWDGESGWPGTSLASTDRACPKSMAGDRWNRVLIETGLLGNQFCIEGTKVGELAPELGEDALCSYSARRQDSEQ